MKATTSKNRSLNLMAILVISFCCAFLNLDVNAQDDQSSSTLFKPDSQVSFVWSPEMKVSTIKNETGTAMGFYAGALINRSFLIGGAFGASADYSTVNYCYFGIIGQYTYKAHKLVHPSAQLLLAAGSTLDYENERPNIFDDELKSGVPLCFAEPGINLEVNLGQKVRFVTGLSYRFAYGMEECSDYLYETNLTDHDLSGVNFNLGLKFGRY